MDALVDAVVETLDALRRTGPLVHCQTNNVVTGFTANVLLAAGCSPAMVDDVEDAAVFATLADGLLVNLGTLAHERSDAMRAAVAARGDLPWVLDPVAAGPLPARTALARELLARRPTVLRGNASEILGVAGDASAGRGVDAGDGPEAALGTARDLADTYGCVVAVSGPVDVITDGVTVVRVTAGHPLMTQVTGVGCALGALVAATLAVAPPVVAATAATALLCAAGSRAAIGEVGPGTFAVRLLDQLAALTSAEVVDDVVLT
ncbi:MAG TPA: hydroxyethylthiazole kinase [Mycobacteriales bacterium]